MNTLTTRTCLDNSVQEAAAYIASQCHKLVLAGVTAAVLAGSAGASAQTILYRQNTILIPLPANAHEAVTVTMDNQDVTPFSTINGNNIELTVPFPAKKDAFEITISDASGEQILHTETYRRARASEVFDSVDTTVSGQFNTAFVADRSNDDFSGFGDEDSAQSDLLAALSIETQRGGIRTIAEIEGVNRTDPNQALRADGPNADISRFNIRSEFAPSTNDRAFISAGDTELYAANSLVNTGMSSRGIVAGYESSNSRFKLELGRLHGSDIVGTVHGPLGWSNDSYRTGLNSSYTVLETPRMSWSIHGSALDVKRTPEDSYGVGQTADAETNRVFGIGTSLAAFQNKLRLNMNWAHSSYNNPADENSFAEFDNSDDFELFSPGATTGTAWRHELNWDAWAGSLGNTPGSIGFELSAEQATPLFRSVQGTATADRKQWAGAINATLGLVTARLDTTQFRNNLDNLISIHTLDEAVHNASVSIDLEHLRSGGNRFESNLDLNAANTSVFQASKLIPSSLGLTTQVQDVKTLNGEDIILAPVIDGFDFMNQTTETIGLSASWINNQHTTTVESSYSFLDIDQRERAEADRRDVYHGVSHTYQNNQWSVSGRIGVSRTNDLDPASRSDTTLNDWGVSTSYLTLNGLRLGASFENSLSRLADRLSDDNARSTSRRYNVSIDIGDWYAHQFNLTNAPSISASWQKTEGTETNAFDNSANSTTSATLNIGVNF